MEQNKIENHKENEKVYIQRLMHVCKGNIMQAVIVSGLSRATLYRKIAQYKVQRYN